MLALALPISGLAAAPDIAWTALSADGAWSGYGEPHAVARGGKTFAGWITARGSVEVGVLGHTSGVSQISTLAAKSEQDDHAAPALLFQPDGRLMAFYGRRGTDDLHLRITTRPGDISEWTPDQSLGLFTGPAKRHGIVNPSPVILTSDQNAIYIFFMGADGYPAFSVSSSLGKSWTPPRTLVKPDAGPAPTDAARPPSNPKNTAASPREDHRPIFKVWSDGKGRIDIAFTDGHPNDRTTGAICFARLEKGAFWKASGTRIAGLGDLPLRPAACDRVDEGAAAGGAWLWDVAEDAAGQPVIAYTELARDSEPRHRYARWDGKKWADHEVCLGGKSFAQPSAGKKDAEYELGGLSLDHAHPASLVVSRPANERFEIERWTTPDGGTTWTSVAITAASQQDNVRPSVVRGQDGTGPAVLWMNLRRYAHFTDYDAALLMDRPTPKPRALTSQRVPGAIRAAIESVADWQLAHPGRYPTTDWTQGALYAGMMALAGISPEPRYREAMKAMGMHNEWNPGPRIYHADDHCVGQTYAELFELYREERMLDPLKERFDFILAHPATNSLAFEGPSQEITRRWSWCDALFMGPPAWLRLYRLTGDRRYRDFAVSEWWKTSEFLFDREEHLFYRDSRYFPQREANGRKVFWSRGNGWVLAGLARVLQVLPGDDPDRGRFIAQFQAMAEAVAKCQQPDGLWRSSLLDPASYPLQETSGSGFYTFALAWGINQGLLSRTNFEPVVARGWEGLVRCVNPDGRLTHVQPVGADPKKFDSQHTDVYGVGAFLLAGTELYRLALLDSRPQVALQVANTLKMRRPMETVELRWADVASRLGGQPGDSIAVLDPATSKMLDHQVVDENGDGQPDLLLFQGDFLPGETRRFLLLAGLSPGNQPSPALTTHGRFVPERKDDYAWENDRIAYRVYGPALQNTPGETSGSGVDVWLKSTRQPVLDAWYAGNDYHKDHGEGLDAYKVGTSRGCGGLAIVAESNLYASADFARWRQLAEGPIRTLVELEYASWPAGARQVSEVRRIALDRGSNLNRMESELIPDPPGELTVAVGVATRPGNGVLQADEKQGWLTYTEPEAAPHGRTHTALAFPGPFTSRPHPDHGLAIQTVRMGEPLVYYAGAGWSKADFPTPESWRDYVQSFMKRTSNPLVVRWKE